MGYCSFVLGWGGGQTLYVANFVYQIIVNYKLHKVDYYNQVIIDFKYTRRNGYVLNRLINRYPCIMTF